MLLTGHFPLDPLLLLGLLPMQHYLSEVFLEGASEPLPLLLDCLVLRLLHYIQEGQVVRVQVLTAATRHITHHRRVLVLALKDPLVTDLLQVLQSLLRESSFTQDDFMDLSPESPIGYNFLFFIFFIHCIFYLVESHRGYFKDGRIFE
jgi:hypothetical protein